MAELTNRQLEQQDEVNNAIHALLEKLAWDELEYDAEFVGALRDVISKEFQERGIMTEMEFYPWIEE